MPFLSRAVFAMALCAGFGKAQAPAPKPVDPGKAAVIGEMLMLNHSDQAVKQLLDQYRANFKKPMEDALSSALRQQGITETNRFNPDVQKFESRIFDMLGERLAWERMKPEFVRIYDETFTLEELQGIVAFYRSPTGQALLTKMPALITRSGQVSQAQVRDVVPQVQKLTQEFIDDLKKKAAETK